MSYLNYRCMLESEDTDEGTALCTYPQCWLEDCPHKQAREKLHEIEQYCLNSDARFYPKWFWSEDIKKILSSKQKGIDKDV